MPDGFSFGSDIILRFIGDIVEADGVGAGWLGDGVGSRHALLTDNMLLGCVLCWVLCG